jgi:signal transduction histidine kinase
MADYDPSLARMIITLMNAHEQEWTRVSRILHDEVGQTMSAVGLQLDVLRMDLQDRVPEITSRTLEIQELLERVISQVRDLSYELNPAVAEKVGFHFAMERLIGRYRQKFPGTLRLMVDLAGRLPPEVGSALYKIADQALANAIQHAQCSQIEVMVKPSHKGTVLEVADHGKGFDVRSVKDHVSGLGLLLMEYHASQAKIDLTVTSAPGEGTIVRALYPHSASQKERGMSATTKT